MNKKLMMTFLIAFAIFSVGMQMEGCCNCFGTCDDDKDKHTQQATVCADADGDDFGKLYFAGAVPLGADTLPGGCGLNGRDCDDTDPKLWEVCDGAWIMPPLPANTIKEKEQYTWQVHCVITPELANPIGATFDIMIGDSVNGIAGDDNLNTCKGKIENDQLDGQADYVVTPPEEQGGDTCLIHVGCKITWDENNDGRIDALTEVFTYVKAYEVFVREVNVAPVFNTPPNDAPLGCYYIFPMITDELNWDLEAADEDLPKTLATDPGSFTCAITQDNCLVKNSSGQMVTWMTVDNSCHLVGDVPGYYNAVDGTGVKPGDLCTVTVRATDGWGVQTSQIYDVWYIDPNRAPVALMEINHIFTDECEVDIAYDPVIFDPDQPNSCQYQPGWYKCELTSNSCADILALDPNTCILHYRDVYNGGSPIQVADRETWGGRDCVLDFKVTDAFNLSDRFQYTVYISECDNASPVPIFPGPVFRENVARNDIPLFQDIDLPPAGLDCEVNDACFIICDVISNDPICDPWIQFNRYGCTVSGTAPEYNDWKANDLAGQVANFASGDCAYTLRVWDGADWDNDPPAQEYTIYINVLENNLYPIFNNKVPAQTICDGDPEGTGGYFYDPDVSDPDLPGTLPEATVTCSLTSISTPLCASWLTVDPNTCVVSGIPAEAHAQGDKCTYKITATDQGTPALSTSLVVTLTINDCNEKPYWEECMEPVDLRVMPGDYVNLVNGLADDNDKPDTALGHQGALTCVLKSITCEPSIGLNPATVLDLEVTSDYSAFPDLSPVGCELDFTAPSSFGPDFKAVCELTVKVDDGSTEADSFIESTFSLTIGCIAYVDSSVLALPRADCPTREVLPPYTDPDAPPFYFSEGVSWRYAHSEIQEAVAWADGVPEERECEVWVAQGDYTQPTHYAPFIFFPAVPPALLTCPALPVVQMAQGVDIIGSFQAIEHTRDERGSAFIYETVLTNECLTAPSRVVEGAPDAELAGLILQLGNHTQGGGLYYDSDLAMPLQVLGCIFENNFANEGGGIYVNGINGAVMEIRNTVFNGNRSDNGGGVYGVDIDLDIKNALFTRNQATVDGGGVYFTSSNPSGRKVEIINSTFAENQSDSDDNLSGLGGAINTGMWMGLSVKDSIFYKNEHLEYSPNIYTLPGSVTSVRYSMFYHQDYSDEYTAPVDAHNHVGYDPFFVIDTLTNDDAPEGAYFLDHSVNRYSPAINIGSALFRDIFDCVTEPNARFTTTFGPNYTIEACDATNIVDIGFHYPSKPTDNPFDK